MIRPSLIEYEAEVEAEFEAETQNTIVMIHWVKKIFRIIIICITENFIDKWLNT